MVASNFRQPDGSAQLPATVPSAWQLWLTHARQIVRIAWPIYIGQLAIIAYGVLDTMMTARYSANDLAALSIGAGLYISVFLGLSGILQALSPTIGHLFGAQSHDEIGEELRQGVWLALALTLPGMLLLAEPGWLLAIAHADPVLEHTARQYLQMEALGLPAALLSRLYGSLNTAISQARRVMVMQLTGLVLKVPLNWLLIFGLPALGIPALGGPGSALATALTSWLVMLLLGWQLVRDSQPGRLYHPYGLFARWSWPHWSRQWALLKLGIPMGLSYLIEVTSFTFMALFIARFGATALAGHQIVANFAAVLYMLPLSLAIGTATCVAQALGAAQPVQARQTSLHGIWLTALIATLMGGLIWLCRALIVSAYTPDPMVAAAALPLFVFIGFYQIFDAVQVTTAFVLRAYKITLVPTLIYALSLWGFGLGGGYLLGFNQLGGVPAELQGASGFWLANSTSLSLAALLLLLYFLWVARQKA
ncbi:MATE family efflux transporter [Ampullimonas aquatilis]|uniref:MATE family efflux transporter n=1 Tax=Ampullimonas aquatilis TaxID=1341549 RepID=UPI003C763DFF